MMAWDHWVSLFSSAIAFVGLLFVARQIRDSTRQREMDSVVEILSINRELITLGFSHPQLFAILNDSKDANPIWEQYYLQLWLNQFALTHSYMTRSVLRGEFRENLTRDVTDFMAMQNMRRHWQRFGRLYPATFQSFVNEKLKEVEPPPLTAQPQSK
jgi:hypothetical protein